MTTEISNPSPEVPAQPQLKAAWPDGGKPFPGVPFTLAAGVPVPEGEFTPNVLVSIRRFPVGMGLGATIADMHARCLTLQEFALANEEDYDAHGYPGYRIAYAYIDPQVGTVLQSGRAYVVKHGDVEDVVQITSTCTAAQAETYVPQIKELEESVIVVKP